MNQVAAPPRRGSGRGAAAGRDDANRQRRLYALRYYSLNPPEHDEGWPTMAAVGLVVASLGGALSFLIVFSVSWAVELWKEARRLLCECTTSLVELSTLMHSSAAFAEREDSATKALAREFDATSCPARIEGRGDGRISRWRVVATPRRRPGVSDDTSR